MYSPERGIVFTDDLDGVHFKASPPLKTSLRLLRRDVSLPEVGRSYGEFHQREGMKGVILTR